MERDIDEVLRTWLDRADRRPLVLRGARQVGKTFSVRAFARASGRELIEVNFERDPDQRRIFATRDPHRIVADLSLLTNREIAPDRSLLFLDEVQAAGEVLACLRWLYEEMPALPVVAAGSLLEFALADHAMSMPVGRVTFRHLEPMSFPEYLLAHGQGRLRATLAAWRPGVGLSETAQQLATTWFDRYMMVGGMPAAVAADVAGQTARRQLEMQSVLPQPISAPVASWRLLPVGHQVGSGVAGAGVAGAGVAGAGVAGASPADAWAAGENTRRCAAAFRHSFTRR